VVAPLTVFTVVILVFAYWYTKKNSFKRKSIMLPKSLVMHLTIYLIIDANVSIQPLLTSPLTTQYHWKCTLANSTLFNFIVVLFAKTHHAPQASYLAVHRVPLYNFQGEN
jgi:hypothetical protein